MYQMIEEDGKKFLVKTKEPEGKRYKLTPWRGRRTDVYGNNRACKCPDLMNVDTFCVCIGRAWCPAHGGPRCVGGHD